MGKGHTYTIHTNWPPYIEMPLQAFLGACKAVLSAMDTEHIDATDSRYIVRIDESRRIVEVGYPTDSNWTLK